MCLHSEDSDASITRVREQAMHEETASDKGKGRQEPHLTKNQIKHLQVSSNKQTKWSGVIEMRGMKDSEKVTGSVQGGR